MSTKQSTPGQRIATLRKAANLSQKRLAIRIDSTASTLSDIETGKSSPRYSTLLALCKEFGVDINHIAGVELSETSQLFGGTGIDAKLWGKFAALHSEYKSKVVREILFLHATNIRHRLALSTTVKAKNKDTDPTP